MAKVDEVEGVCRTTQARSWRMDETGALEVGKMAQMAGRAAQQEARAARCKALPHPCFAAKTAIQTARTRPTRPTRQGNTQFINTPARMTAFLFRVAHAILNPRRHTLDTLSLAFLAAGSTALLILCHDTRLTSLQSCKCGHRPICSFRHSLTAKRAKNNKRRRSLAVFF